MKDCFKYYKNIFLKIIYIQNSQYYNTSKQKMMDLRGMDVHG